MLPIRDMLMIHKYKQVESKRIDKDILCKQQTQGEVAIVISDKIEFKTKGNIKNKYNGKRFISHEIQEL